MKRKRSASPVARRSSRSPLSPRSTRASNRTPPRGKPVSPAQNEKIVNGDDSANFSIRRSSRARRSSYSDYNTSHNDDSLRKRDSSKDKEKSKAKNGRSRSSSPETEDIETPFFNHVRFSPSAKPGSPARWQRQRSSQRAAANIARMRLHNVPSEDEQSEFNRRYSRDLRSRRRGGGERKGNFLQLYYFLNLCKSYVHILNTKNKQLAVLFIACTLKCQ